jgi:hypothetical protein
LELGRQHLRDHRTSRTIFVSMSDIDGAANDLTDLRDEVSRIEGEPLAERAAEYAQLHDQLHTRLSGADVTGRNG